MFKQRGYAVIVESTGSRECFPLKTAGRIKLDLRIETPRRPVHLNKHYIPGVACKRVDIFVVCGIDGARIQTVRLIEDRYFRRVLRKRRISRQCNIQHTGVEDNRVRHARISANLFCPLPFVL